MSIQKCNCFKDIIIAKFNHIITLLVLKVTHPYTRTFIYKAAIKLAKEKLYETPSVHLLKSIVKKKIYVYLYKMLIDVKG